MSIAESIATWAMAEAVCALPPTRWPSSLEELAFFVASRPRCQTSHGTVLQYEAW